MSNIMFKDGKPIGGIPQKGQSVTIPFMTKLWENPDPTASMGENVNINLSSDDYDYLLIEYSRYSSESNSFRFSAIAEKGISIILDCAITTSNGARSVERVLNYINDSRLRSKSAYIATGTTARSEDNACVIPLAIYGFKKSYDIENVAIAEVSTSASRCMLEDGVTSVEQAINREIKIEETIETLDTIASDGLVSITATPPNDSSYNWSVYSVVSNTPTLWFIGYYGSTISIYNKYTSALTNRPIYIRWIGKKK